MKLDKVKYLKRVIAISWLALLACCIIKIFGGNFFVIMCENERFIAVCEYADTHFWADFLLSGTYCYISMYFWTLAVCGKTRFERWELMVFTLTIIIGTIVKILSINFGLIFDIWQGFILPFIFVRKTPKRFIMVIIGNILLVLFQMVSLITKDIGLTVLSDEHFLIGIIFSIDSTLMIFLYYLYMLFTKNKKEGTDNG